MPLHDGEMYGVAGGKANAAEDDLFCAFGGGPVDGKDIIHHAEKRVECKLNIVAAVDGGVTVQDLLENFRVCDEPLAFADQAL